MVKELHETVHWRRIKRIILLLSKAEDVDIVKYNLDKITCWRTYRFAYESETMLNLIRQLVVL